MKSTADLTPRQKLGLQAGYQAEAMFRALLCAARQGDDENLAYLMRAMLPRLLDLNEASMAAHDVQSERLEDVRERLDGGYAQPVGSGKGGAA